MSHGTSTASTTTPAAAEHGGSLGLPQATALIVGSIIGTGIFTLPSAIASYGMLAIVALLVVSVGALALALMFGSLSQRIPAAGGPYAYSRHYFGDFAGFTNAWPYWITAWAGNAGIVVSWVFYVDALFGWDPDNKPLSVGIAMVGLWIPAAINLIGINAMGIFQLWTSVIKFIPLVFISTVGLVIGISKGNFPAFNPSGDSVLGAISTAGALVLFSYLGVETAAVAAAKIKNPVRNVPRATIYGTLACAAVYLLSTVAVFGLVPTDVLQSTGAPFSSAFNSIFGGDWAGRVVAAFAVVSGIGCLIGWTMICAEMPKAAADDGLFPKFFAKVNKANVPLWGVLFSTALASVFTIFSYASSTGVQVFSTLVLLSGVTAAIPYFMSAIAQIYYLMTEGKLISPTTFARDMVIAILSLLFSFWFVYGSGQQATFWAYLMILVGYVVLMGLYVGQWRTRKAAGATDGPQVVDARRP
jgi:APA family basic amino acid/polyamine antiporter